MLLSEAADGEGDGGAREAVALRLDGLDSLDAAEARLPLNTEDCFSRYDDMLGGDEPSSGSSIVEGGEKRGSEVVDEG